MAIPEGQELVTIRTRYEVRIQVLQIREELVTEIGVPEVEWREIDAEDVETTETIFQTIDYDAAVDCGEAVKLAAGEVCGDKKTV